MGINARELIGLSLILAAATPYLREALRFIGVTPVALYRGVDCTTAHGPQFGLRTPDRHNCLT